MRRSLIAVLALLALPAVAGADAQRLVFPTLLGEYQLAFDDKRTTESEVRALVILSPHLPGWSAAWSVIRPTSTAARVRRSRRAFSGMPASTSSAAAPP